MRIRMWRHATPQVSVLMASNLRRTWLAALLLSCWWWPAEAQAAEALVLARDTLIRVTPHVSSRVVKTAQPGETYEIPGRRSGKGQPLYIMDERGELWVKVLVTETVSGFVRTDLVSVAREEYRPARGTTLLIVNLRPTADGGVSRELWVAQDGWQRTRRLATIEGRPVWASHGEWFICQVESERPIKDQSMDRTVERIERFSADGRVRTMLAVGSAPVLLETRGEVFFYRDLDDQGEAVPPGLFAVHVDGAPSPTGVSLARTVPVLERGRRLFRPSPAANPLPDRQSDHPARLRDHGNQGTDHGGPGRPVPRTPSRVTRVPREFPSRRRTRTPETTRMMTRWIPGWLALALAGAAVMAILPATPTPAAWAASPAGPLPPEIVSHFTPEDVARGHAYMQGRYWLFTAGTLLRLAALAVLVFTPASAALRNFAVRLVPAHPALAVALYIACLCIAFELLTLPMGYYAGFVREHAFGLSTQTPGAWLLDRLKGAAVSLALAVPLGSLLALLWRRYPGRWVLPAWGLGGLVVVLLVALAPIVIDPLFHTIRPLQNAALRERVLALADRAGIPV